MSTLKEAVDDFSRAIELNVHSDVYSSRALAYAHLSLVLPVRHDAGKWLSARHPRYPSQADRTSRHIARCPRNRDPGD